MVNDAIPEGKEFLIQLLSPDCVAEAATARRRPVCPRKVCLFSRRERS